MGAVDPFEQAVKLVRTRPGAVIAFIRPTVAEIVHRALAAGAEIHDG